MVTYTNIITKNILSLATLILSLLLIWGCNRDNFGPENQEPLDPNLMKLESFSFAQTDNGTILKKDIKTAIKGSVIDDLGGVEYNLNTRKLIATFETSTTGEVSEITVSIGTKGDETSFKPLINKKTPADYLRPVVIRLSGIYKDRTITKDYEFRLHNLNTGLPIVYIFTPDGSDITSKDLWTQGCSIFIDAAGKKDYDGTVYNEDYNGTMDKVRGRGNTTWKWAKKPYALKLDKRASLLGMPMHKRWVLLACAIDKTFLRNRIAHEIATRCGGLEWTPRNRYVELIINGKHKGTYQLMEQIKCDPERVPIPSGNDSLDPMKGGSANANPEEMGFLLEADRYWGNMKYETAPFWWPSSRYSGSGTSNWINTDMVSWAKHISYQTNYSDNGQLKFKFGLKDPDDDKFFNTGSYQYQYIQKTIQDVERQVLGYNHDISRIDINSFIDYWFVYELTLNQEPNNPGSCYMYKKPESAGGKIYAGPIWDFDYGTYDSENTDHGLYYGKSGKFLIMNSLWYVGLFENSEFRRTVKQRWAALKPKLDFDSFIKLNHEYLKKSAELNYTMWPDGGGDNPNYDQKLDMAGAIDMLHGNLKDRIRNMDILISQIPD